MRLRWLVVAASVAACSREPAAETGPSFRRDIAPVLEKHCTAKECHGAEPAPDVDLDLRAPFAYRQLVGVPAEMGEIRRSRVVPYDVYGSFLVHKLAGPSGPREGKRMPLDPATGEPLERSPLPSRFVDDVIVKWIEEGAPDN
ncbi:MAG TPA: hypothetical protein VMZ53_24170 [Kofleriaceae bacterium]|nr:hypothetical protein [Kofleriaceae bacterium]